AGIAILGFSATYYFSGISKEVFLSNPYLPIVFFAAGAIMLMPSNPQQKNFVGPVTRQNFVLIAVKWVLAFYLIYIAIGGYFKVPLPDLLSISSGIGMIILTLIGIFELVISFRR
ncbi:MAG: hypothetical protein AABW93_02010, partial [Nanoarchaeota archaeon]